MSVSHSHNARSCLCADLYGFLLLTSFSLIARLSFMVYLFDTKSVESLQLRFRIEDAVYIMLLCKSWTKRSMWEHQAWCWAKDTRGLFAGCLWPRGQSLLPELQCLPSTGCNSTTRAAEGMGTSNRVCPEALWAGKHWSSAGFPYLAEKGQEHYGQ